MAYIISADDIKKTLPGYDPEHSDVLHRESAKLADKEYETAIKTRSENKVILMSGGTASGKTEYISEYLSKKSVIVFDGTLPSYEGAKIKIRKALKHGKIVEIHAVLPDDFLRALIAFLNRDRKFPPEHFYRTHSSSRKTLLEIAKNFPEVPICVVVSSYHKRGDSKMLFKVLTARNREELIEFIEQNQYNEDEIKQIAKLL